MSDETECLRVVRVPVLDVGLGRAAGYESDAELMKAYFARQAELERVLAPEALARIAEAEKSFFGP